MFIRVSSVLALALCASASVLPSTGAGQCNVDQAQCCQSVEDAKSSSLGSLLGLLEATLGPITGQVGVSCNPISVLGTNGCTAQPVCCENNSFNGLVALGCIPIHIGF